MSHPPAAPQPSSSVEQCHLPTLRPIDAAQGLGLSNGLTKWFAEEVHPHGAQLKSYLRGAFPSVRDVDDVVQESYLRVWKLRATQTIQSAKGILFTVARHVALDLVRRNRTSPVESVADLADLSVVEERENVVAIIDQKEKVILLAKALATLPDRTREIVVLRKFHGVPQKDVAEQFGLSEAAVEHQVARGLKKCEAWMRKAGIENLYDERR